MDNCTLPMHIIARAHTDFVTKFGIPRQSGLVPESRATIVMEPPYRQPEALRGLDGFSHLWLVWYFSASAREDWSPTVRPPRLGGNARMGVFATRSPYRPNAIALSSVRLESIEWHTPQGPVLHVSGADLMDGTPLLDIKPYLPYTDSHPDAVGGFAADVAEPPLAVVCPPELAALLSPHQRDALTGVLTHDPRPRYQQDPGRVYGMDFAAWRVRFSVAGDTLTVLDISPRDADG